MRARVVVETAETIPLYFTERVTDANIAVVVYQSSSWIIPNPKMSLNWSALIRDDKGTTIGYYSYVSPNYYANQSIPDGYFLVNEVKTDVNTIFHVSDADIIIEYIPTKYAEQILNIQVIVGDPQTPNSDYYTLDYVNGTYSKHIKLRYQGITYISGGIEWDDGSYARGDTKYDIFMSGLIVWGDENPRTESLIPLIGLLFTATGIGIVFWKDLLPRLG